MISGIKSIHNILILVLALIFILGMFALVLAGINVYHSISEQMEINYSVYTGLDYISAKIRSSDRYGGVEITDFSGIPALLLYEDLDGYEYMTYIYCKDGFLMELFCESGAGLSPDDGSPLLEMDSLDLENSGGLFKIACRVGGDSAETSIFVRSCGRFGL